MMERSDALILGILAQFRHFRHSLHPFLAKYPRYMYGLASFNHNTCFFIITEFEEFIFSAFDSGGMNYRQRNCALFECIRERCERTAHNHKLAYKLDVDCLLNRLFLI
jgi:hypothetical protein